MTYQNREPNIFILSGKAKSGKNTVAKIITDYYQDKKIVQLSFAYYLKQYVKTITGWDGSGKTKPRDFLQSFGIDLLKRIDPYFLINRVCQDIQVYKYFYDVIMITDARLIEEIEVLKERFNKVTVIRIKRDNVDNGLLENQKNHITETALDSYTNFDYIVDNSKDIKYLEQQIRQILKEVDYE